MLIERSGADGLCLAGDALSAVVFGADLEGLLNALRKTVINGLEPAR